ncbi:hypothetical protein E2562_028290 [Oryza meyeriana var. granulata]|uniref:Uncharacterized protein n=1 Tax=Oryza meyeriana var. granulata TaxID=110450 RepID=A0A6G1E2Q3_9ORYZ|nr:hypothetical protein E2562_028290 [Oryza meyeriana var. granulata]
MEGRTARRPGLWSGRRARWSGGGGADGSPSREGFSPAQRSGGGRGAGRSGPRGDLDDGVEAWRNGAEEDQCWGGGASGDQQGGPTRRPRRGAAGIAAEAAARLRWRRKRERDGAAGAKTGVAKAATGAGRRDAERSGGERRGGRSGLR